MAGRKRISKRKLTFIPIRKVLISGGNSEFECGIDELSIQARVVGEFICLIRGGE